MSAKCLSGFEWSFSSTAQSPCVVAVELAGICIGGQFNLAPLDPGAVYLGPSPESADSCRCSSVYYALLSACAYCQTRSFIRWSSYMINCPTPYLQRFVEPIPSGISVPLWAYQDVSIDDFFNVTLAQTNATNTHTTSTTRPGPTTGSTTGINVAAIAGGLVGGFVVIGLVVGLVVFCLTRRSRSSSRNPNRTEESQTQDFPTNIPPYMAPGFSSSVMPNAIPSASRVSASQASQPFYQTGFVDVSPPPLSSRRVPFIDTTTRDSKVQSQSEYMMTAITPYTIPSPTSPYIPSSSQDSKQPLLEGPSSNFTDMPTTSAFTFHPASSSTSSSYQRPHQVPQEVSMSPLTLNEQLPAYSEIMMAGATSHDRGSEKRTPNRT